MLTYDLQCMICGAQTSANESTIGCVQRLGCSECGGYLKITSRTNEQERIDE